MTESATSRRPQALIVAGAIAATAIVVVSTVSVASSAHNDATLTSFAQAQAAQADADRAALVVSEAQNATHLLVKANADHVATILTRDASGAGAMIVADYVATLGRTEEAIDSALAAKFAGADVTVDYVVSGTTPVIKVWHSEDYKVAVNLSNTIAEVFAPIT